MSDYSAKILIIDDEPGLHKALSNLLSSEFSIETAYSGTEGLKKVGVNPPDLILLDLQLPQMSGMQVLRQLKQTQKASPVIILTAYGSVNSAVAALKMGAIDYINKPFENWKLKQVVEDALKKQEANFKKSLSTQEIIGQSPQIAEVWRLIEKYGPTDLPILLQGETGTGKELFAKAIHEVSKRREEAFVPMDCATMPDTLFDSELFGYKKGAFTGANSNKQGRLAWANKGTLFLDEIANLPLSDQAKLLRVIQEQKYVPLGAKGIEDTQTMDVRFVSATNAKLTEAIEGGTFREDLYYRIAGVCIELPPLRERKGDIELLIRHFMRKYNQPDLEISDEAMEQLLSYPWPGNVRELEQTIGAIAATTSRVVTASELPPKLLQRKSVAKNKTETTQFELNFSYDLTQPIDLKRLKAEVAAEAESLIVAKLKKVHPWNQTELATFLGIDAKTLRRIGSPNENYDSR